MGGRGLTYLLEPMASNAVTSGLRGKVNQCMEYLWHFPFCSWSGTHFALAREQVAHALMKLSLEVPRLDREWDAGLKEPIPGSELMKNQWEE